MAWKYTTRKINGRRRRVKVHTKQNGKVLVRMVGHRNTSDRTAISRRRKKR